jgi:hypothetical protein
LSSLVAISLGEAIVHGRDLARAAGRPWPVSADWARSVFLGLLPVLPHYLLPERATGRHHRFDIRLRGRPTVGAVFSITDGILKIEPPAARQPADCRISGDPWAFLLVLYGRTGPARPAATGQIVAWGRRPWLAFVLPTLFRKP